MRAVRTLRAPIAIAVLVLGLSGCSLLSGSSTEASSEASAGAASSGTSAAPALTQDGRVKDSQASITRRYQGYNVTIDVLRLVRHDQATRAEFVITPRSNGSTNPLSTSILGGSSDASGVYLLDEVNLRKYVVLRSDDDQCICSSDLESLPLNQPALLFADFPVAPQDVTALSLVVPEIGPLPAVKLT